MKAYEHGIVMKCSDGVTCRIFPRIFTYSADYPEKYVLYRSLAIFCALTNHTQDSGDRP